jgi:hypothetical protein
MPVLHSITRPGGNSITVSRDGAYVEYSVTLGGVAGSIAGGVYVPPGESNRNAARRVLAALVGAEALRDLLDAATA